MRNFAYSRNFSKIYSSLDQEIFQNNSIGNGNKLTEVKKLYVIFLQHDFHVNILTMIKPIIMYKIQSLRLNRGLIKVNIYMKRISWSSVRCHYKLNKKNSSEYYEVSLFRTYCSRSAKALELIYLTRRSWFSNGFGW